MQNQNLDYHLSSRTAQLIYIQHINEKQQSMEKKLINDTTNNHVIKTNLQQYLWKCTKAMQEKQRKVKKIPSQGQGLCLRLLQLPPLYHHFHPPSQCYYWPLPLRYCKQVPAPLMQQVLEGGHKVEDPNQSILLRGLYQLQFVSWVQLVKTLYLNLWHYHLFLFHLQLSS